MLEHSHLDKRGLARVEDRKKVIAAAILKKTAEAIFVKSVECSAGSVQSKQETRTSRKKYLIYTRLAYKRQRKGDERASVTKPAWPRSILDLHT